jgi:hypothetical protein
MEPIYAIISVHGVERHTGLKGAATIDFFGILQLLQ